MTKLKNEQHFYEMNLPKKHKTRKVIPDMALTKNHKDLKYRLRIQEDEEADEEIKKFIAKDENTF